jgi:hypothetical protein
MARGKTETLPGVSNGKIIQEVSEAAESYENIRDKRMKLTEQESEANTNLVTVMRKHKLKAYRDDNFDPPLMVELAAKDATIKAKVKREKAEAEVE